MNIKKERLEEIVKEELEAFYEGEVPVEEGVGDMLSRTMKALTKGAQKVAGTYTPKDPDLEAEEQAKKEKQRKQEQIAALVADLKGRSKGLTPKEFTRQMAFLRKALDKPEI
jgi:hypothetical protein